jgi:hypothetical protein
MYMYREGVGKGDGGGGRRDTEGVGEKSTHHFVFSKETVD